MPKKSILMDDTTTPTSKEAETVTVKKTELNAILSRLAKLEENPSITTEKKRYTGPRMYQVRLISGKVIQDFPPMSRENNFVGKNQYGGIEERQTCEVHYVDGSVEKMNFFDYAQAVTWSEPMHAKKVENNIKVFFADRYRETEIMPKAQFEEEYKVLGIEGAGKVIDWYNPKTGDGSVLKIEEYAIYTFENPDYNNGEEFSVTHNAIN